MELVGGPPSSFGLVDITEGISGSKASTLYYKYAVVTTRPTEAIATTTYELPPPAVSGGSYATSESSIWESSLPNSESSNWESSLPNSESSDWESSLPKLRSHPPVQGGLEPISGGQPYLSETPPNNTGIIVGSVVGGVAVLAIAGIVIFFIYRRSKRYQIPPEPVWDTPEFVYPAAAGKATSEGESTSAHVPFQTSQGQGQGSAVEIGGQERKAGLQGRLQYDCWHWVGRPKL
ncbi:hypothetical protein M011DRAFT_16554 [Sporormia fimetaria CBS 119925]|uniref:Uncharacterized protein n=1 Tax=Sporormia fimetaria CBS 119925 TaxID=1340428 RepID=A0A6A6VQN4_9PLEO|nr:hypothetical protein M011DRAFT_16554 [Sporormia fimetaria CBS 119925]